VNRRRCFRHRLSLATWFSLWLLLSATIAGAQNRPQIQAELTLSEALRMALFNSTLISAAQARLEQSTGESTQSRSVLLPQIGIDARQSYYTASLAGLALDVPGIASRIGPAGAMDARVVLSEEALNISKLRAWQASRSQEDSSRFLVNDARELVTLAVVSTYLDALKAKASRDSLLEQSKLAKDLYQLTRDRVNQGVSAELDANREMQQVNSLEQQRQESEQAYIAAKLELAKILQARVTSEFEVSDRAAYGDTLSQVIGDRDATLRAAVASRADYRSAEASVRAAELSVESAKALRLPVVRIIADDGQSGTTPVHNINTYQVKGVLDVPIFTSGRIRGETEEARGVLREARARRDDIQSQIEKEVLTAISGVDWALKEVETSVGNATLSRREVELTRARFFQGVSDNTELINAQTRLSQAEDAHIRALHTLGLARANLTRAMGQAMTSYAK